MTSKEALKRVEKSILDTTGTTIEQEECIYDIEKDLEEYEIAENLIHELGNILYGDDEECKTEFDIIKRCQWKILQYLEDKAKRLRTEKLVKEELENDK